MKNRFKTLGTLFGDDDTMAPLVAQHRRLAHLQHLFAETLPPGWEKLCRVAAIEGSTVIIAAANGAIATNLKAYAPRLLEKFRLVLEKKTKQEQEVTGIRFMVQPEISTWRPPTPTSIRLASTKKPMSDAQLNDLTQKLADSPLKTTLTRIQSKRRASSQASSKRVPTNKSD